MPMPRTFSSTNGSVRKIEKTATMISAALVTTPALEATPPAIASRGDEPRVQCSRMRLRMNTW
jgi:hypothetical protein